MNVVLPTGKYLYIVVVVDDDDGGGCDGGFYFFTMNESYLNRMKIRSHLE